MWLAKNFKKTKFKCKKTKFMIFNNLDQLDIINITIDEDYTFTIKEQKVKIKKYLGLILYHQLKFYEHIDLFKLVNVLVLPYVQIKKILPLKYCKIFANSLKLPLFGYLDFIWWSCMQDTFARATR